MPALDRAKTIQAAEKFVKAGKILEAVKEYQKLADDNPRDMNVMNKLGDLLARAGRGAEALKHFVRIADFYARDGFFLKAIAMYKKVAKLDPANVDCQQRLAAMYVQQGLTSEARLQYLQLADHLARQNQVPAAIDALRQVLEIDPDNAKVRLGLADMLGRAGKPEDAAREYCLLARTAATRGDLAAAVEALRRGVQASPGLPGLPGLMLSMVTRVEAAPAALVSAAEEMARHAGRSALALLVLGETMRRAGRGPEAEEVLRRLSAGVEADDDLNSEALAVLSRHHESDGRMGEAWEALERAISRAEPGGGGPDPVALLDEFVSRHPEHRQALACRAEIAARAGDAVAEAAALRALATVFVAAKDSARAGEVLKRLGTLAPGDAEVSRLEEALARGVEPPQHMASAPEKAGTPPDAGVPQPVEGAVDEEIEVVLMDSEEPIESVRAEEESRSAEEIFNLEDEGRIPAASDTGVSVEPAAATAEPTAVTPEAPGRIAESEAEPEVESYGPASRIQEIQAADSKGQPVDEDFISEHLTEAEVFVKYGLNGKAREQLQAVLDRYPDHEKARLRLKDILVHEGQSEAAIRECLAIADLLREKGREAEAREVINEAVRLDPESPLVARHRDSVPRPGPEVPAGRGSASSGKVVPPAPVRDPLAIEEVEEVAPTAGTDALPTAPSEGGTAWLSADRDIEIEVAEDDTAMDADESPDFAATTAKSLLPGLAGRHEKADPVPTPATVGGASLQEEEADDRASLADLISGLDGPPDASTVLNAPGRDPDDEKLGEVDFYIEQGLVDEARQVLFQLSKQYPGSAAVSQRLDRLERPASPPAATAASAGTEDLDFEVEQALAGKAPRKAAAPPQARTPAKAPRAEPARPVFKMEKHADNGDGDFIDLGAEISRTLSEESSESAPVSETLDGQAHSFDDIFAAFKKGVEQQVESNDYETHYNLGIAYKEMGLVDEAIGEFQFAAKDPAKTLECCGILGLCFRDKGMPDLALKWYRRGLDMPDLEEHQTLGLRYDIAEVHREKGEYGEALKAYTDVYGVDSNYREVAARIKEMKSHLSSSGR